MAAQAARGDQVAYFFRGRHYPLVPDDRLHRWRRDGVAMLELLNSTLTFGGDTGTLTPESDISHPPSEAAFSDVLEQHRPDVIHIQEIIGLPTSLIDLAVAQGVPVIATLQDYFPLCPVLKLYDIDGQLCHRHDVGAQCARCSAFAPAGRRMFLNKTVAYELRRRLGSSRGDRVVATGERVVGRLMGPPAPAPEDGAAPPPPAGDAAALRYQARRDINVERLSRIDALVAQSHRVAEIYGDLGVERSRLRVIHLTLRHLAELRPQRFESPPMPVKFVTLNGAASREKGADVIVGAARALANEGLQDKFVLDLFGYTSESARERLGEVASVRVHPGYAPGEVDRILDGYHVGIVPSVWEEAYGYVGPEFLSKGIPVIGNARGGIVDYTQDGTTGWVNRSADAEGLAAIMRQIISEPQQVIDRNRWILEHRERIIKPLHRHLQEVDQVYGDVIEAVRLRRSELAELAAQSARRAGGGLR